MSLLFKKVVGKCPVRACINHNWSFFMSITRTFF